jgi:RimJ/RimL family protein N-acetyltransferase
MSYFYSLGTRLFLRPVETTDCLTITRWRNSQEARDAFYIQDIVTPDTHINFVKNRKAHDLVWMVCLDGFTPIGTASLTIDIKEHIAEYGRVYIDKQYAGNGYATELDYLVFSFAFDVLRLKMIWYDPLIHNEAIMKVHIRTGARQVGIDLPGHIDPHGPVMHMQYTPNEWKTNKKIFIEKYGARYE